MTRALWRTGAGTPALMLFFLDGSALAKRYVAEPGTPLLHCLLDHVAPEWRVVITVGFAEVVSMLIRRENAGLLSARWNRGEVVSRWLR